MKTRNITIKVKTYDNLQELPSEDKILMEKAIEALESSYAPYSNYHVGAALLLENGKIILGSNQENVAYPSGLCAERVALFTAGVQEPNVPVKAIAITAKADHFQIEDPITPCGACRQVMAETETRYETPIRILMGNATGIIHVIERTSDLLPLMFEAKELKG
ncbi:MAG: cytidine deaminase [Bacteroidetes bacterium]|nr:MAG: cytidine deaminase [Bacteroidota bacterium]PIE88105.1 MAG: cytidine deaminase [Bacteroidota bacterium]